ncbi:MAG: putative inorganic carbon transporter subunit DabA, partial [Flavobacteriales bacterium]
MKQSMFDEAHLLNELKHYLPSQTPIKEFIHHNTLHAFQSMKFYDAIFKASKIFGYQVTIQLHEFRELYQMGRIRNDVMERVIADRKGKSEVAKWKEKLLKGNYHTHNEPRIGKLRSNWKSAYGIDLDNLVQPLLFRILCAYLDQGVSIQKFPVVKDNFLDSLRSMEKNSFSSFFKTKRVKKFFLYGDCSLSHLLKMVVGDESYFEQYVFDQQFTHQGWSGLVSAVEDHPYTLMDNRPIALLELIAFELLLEMDALDHELGNMWQPISRITTQPPLHLFDEVESTELQEVFKLWQDAFEWSYYDEVLSGISLQLKKEPLAVSPKTFQAMFCIDERECSIRRHIEYVDKNCETLGTPGFFGVEFYFKAEHANFYDKLCPAPVYPNFLIKEHGSKHKREHELLYTDHAHTFLGGTLSSVSLGFGAGVKLLQTLFRPRMSPA